MLAATPLAVAGSGGGSDRATASAAGEVLREGVRNPSAGAATSETRIIGEHSGYTTRQSNLSSTGGGAIFGCRSDDDADSKPCLRANNLSDGRAFEFQATHGNVGGTIVVGGLLDVPNPNAVPFRTNAAGMVANLNAERVGGMTAAQLRGQTGPAGPRGATGPIGPQGPPGSPGTDGTDGTDGEDGTDGASMMSARINGVSSSGTWFGAISGTSQASVAAEGEAVEMLSPPVPVTARDLAVQTGNVAAAPTRLWVNGAPTALHCFPGPTCMDTSNTVAIPASSRLSIEINANAAVGDVMVTWRATTP